MHDAKRNFHDEVHASEDNSHSVPEVLVHMSHFKDVDDMFNHIFSIDLTVQDLALVFRTTFGLTHKSLSKFTGITHAPWMQTQMVLPFESLLLAILPYSSQATTQEKPCATRYPARWISFSQQRSDRQSLGSLTTTWSHCIVHHVKQGLGH